MLASLVCALVFAVADDPVTVEAQVVPIDAPVSAVTLYQGSAAVTRSTSLPQAPGIYELRFANLPASVVPDSLQAKVAAPAKLLDVRYEEIVTPAADVANNPELGKVKAALEVARLKRVELNAKGEIVQANIRTLEAIVSKISQNTAREIGAAELDPAKLKAQLDFLTEQRSAAVGQLVSVQEALRQLDAEDAALKARAQALGGGEKRARTGVVVVAIADTGANATVALTYLARDATWRPSYALRAAGDLSGLDVEYDAEIMQRSGEDWGNVTLTLSTAQPARSASPAPLTALTIAKQPPAVPATAAAPPPPPRPERMLSTDQAGAEDFAIAVRSAFADANIEQSGTVAVFQLPRTVTLPSDSSREQRTRIANIPLRPEFAYVTQPAVDPDVFLRGTTRNTSGYQLLAGRATVFFGNDSVGAIRMGDVAPGAEVELWFGPDRRITAKRSIVSRKQSETGLISKASELALAYKVELTNSMNKPVTVELWDRMPVSQDEDITVTLSDVQPPLLRDAGYENKERKAGLLKWVLQLPGHGADTTPQPTLVRWNVTVSWPKNVSITWFPE